MVLVLGIILSNLDSDNMASTWLRFRLASLTLPLLNNSIPPLRSSCNNRSRYRISYWISYSFNEVES